MYKRQANTVKGYELRLDSRRGKLADSKKLADQLSLDAQEKLRRANLLRELERNLEGFQKSVKTVMKESQRGALSGVHGPVSYTHLDVYKRQAQDIPSAKTLKSL